MKMGSRLALEGGTARARRCGCWQGLSEPLTSSYLPGVAVERLACGWAVVRRWAGTSIATPIRRLVARVPGGTVAVPSGHSGTRPLLRCVLSKVAAAAVMAMTYPRHRGVGTHWDPAKALPREYCGATEELAA